MYNKHEDEEAEWKYKAVCVLLAIVFIINVVVFIWEICQINKLQMQQNKMETIQSDYENSMDTSDEYIVEIIRELDVIKNDSVDIFIGIVVSAFAGVLGTALTVIPINFLKEIFKSVYNSAYYSDAIEKIIVIESVCVAVSFVSEICATISNICMFQDLVELYKRILSALNNVLMTIPLGI